MSRRAGQAAPPSCLRALAAHEHRAAREGTIQGNWSDEVGGTRVEPEIRKVEALEPRKDCERVVDQAQAGGRKDVRHVVLGRGADLDRVARWLRVAAPVVGDVRLAIGRTIRSGPLSKHQAGQLEREAAITQIAANSRQMIDVYANAAVTAREHPASAEHAVVR